MHAQAMTLALLFVIACGSSSAPPAPAPTRAKPVADDAKWRCSADADCMNSCSQGAVSRAWYKDAHVNECDDGCEGWGAVEPKCLDKQCVAFHTGKDGVVRSPGCTHKP